MQRGGKGRASLLRWRVWCWAVEKEQLIALFFCYSSNESSLWFSPSGTPSTRSSGLILPT